MSSAGIRRGAGAYKGDFGGHPDEGARFVTGLMVRDYLATGIPQHPLRFAENDDAHSPKVALGMELALIVVLVLAGSQFKLVHKDFAGLNEPVATLVSKTGKLRAPLKFLISTDARGEGASSASAIERKFSSSLRKAPKPASR